MNIKRHTSTPLLPVTYLFYAPKTKSDLYKRGCIFNYQRQVFEKQQYTT